MTTTTTTNNSNLCATAKIIAQTIDGASERAVLISTVANNNNNSNSGQGGAVVLHRNPAADRFLYHPCKSVSDGEASESAAVNKNDQQLTQTQQQQHLLTDFMVFSEEQGIIDDLRLIEHCRIVMANGKTTRTERDIHWVQYNGNNDNDDTCGSSSCCPCGCGQVYLTAFICSKHERVREIVDHAFDPVLTANEQGIIRTANEAATELFGYTEQELVGHNIHMICGGGHADLHDGYIQSYLETGVQHVIGIKREVLGRKKNGHEFPCELGVQEIKDVSTGQRFFCGFFKDLTLLKQHEAEIQQRQALAQGMINASFDSMFEIDQDGFIQIVNDSACSMFGYSREEFIGSNISMICGDGHGASHDSYIRRYLETGQRHIIGIKRQVKARRKDGSEFEVELGVQEVVLLSSPSTTTATTTGGETNTRSRRAFCGFIRDLTAQKKDKRALRKQQQLIHGKFFAKDNNDTTQQG